MCILGQLRFQFLAFSKGLEKVKNWNFRCQSGDNGTSGAQCPQIKDK